jgi:Zn-dependent protease
VAPGLGGFKYLAGLAFAVLLYLSVLLHEMSHALMAKHYGLAVKSITLHFLGGVTEIDGEPDTPRREFGVSVVGPLTSIATGLVFVALWFVAPDGLLRLAVEGLAGANLLVGVLNLVPGLPLDGGRVLRAAVWQASGNPHKGTIVAGWGGRVTAVAALGWPLAQELFFSVKPTVVDYLLAFVIAAFLWSGASSAIMSAKLRRRLPALKARALARRTLAVPHDVPLAEAVRRAQVENAGSIVVLDSAGRPSGIVNEAALLATPEDRRPWLPTSAVSRSMEPGLMFAADLSGEPLIRAMQATPATEYLLLEPDGSVFGVLTSEDVDKAFAASL